MTCRRRGWEATAALKQRVLTARRESPDLTARLLAERFDVPRSTVEKWLHASGMGQARLEDARGQREAAPRRPRVRGNGTSGEDSEPVVWYDVGER